MRAGTVSAMLTVISWNKKPSTVLGTGGGFMMAFMGHGKETGFILRALEIN